MNEKEVNIISPNASIKSSLFYGSYLSVNSVANHMHPEGNPNQSEQDFFPQ